MGVAGTSSRTMMRPRIDADPQSLGEQVEQYARDHGLKVSRAWADLVRAGLAVETESDDPFVRASDLPGASECYNCNKAVLDPYTLDGATQQGQEYGLDACQEIHLCEGCHNDFLDDQLEVCP